MKKRSMKIVLIVLVVLIVGGIVGMYFAAKTIYDSSFNYRCTTGIENMFDVSEFPTLIRERHTFTSDKGQQLVGYLYEQDDEELEEKAVVVFAHGLGAGGQTGYMDMFNYLTEQGYYVFAYDATANDESEGDVIGGLPQGIIDLKHAIDYVHTLEEINTLPFVYMGYSWGGLSVANVLNYHPDVKAVVSMSGWNESMDLIEHQGIQMVGNVAKLMIPFARVHEYFMYGDYAFSTAMKGFANSDCNVMIIHGAEDDTIPIEYGYEKYFEKYSEDERFVFKKIEGRDHIIFNHSDGSRDEELIVEVLEFLDSSINE